VHDVRFGPTVAGHFLERCSRFHVRAAVDGEPVLAHLPNSGRLHELLHPGALVRLAPRPRPDRRTAYDLVLVARPGEAGDGGCDGAERSEPAPAAPASAAPRWAAVDARLPPRLVAAAAARGLLPVLAGHELVAREPKLGTGRADLLFRGPDGLVLVEAKSITLVDGGVALFPDSPTSRGARHLAALAARRDLRRLVVFVVGRDDARVVRPNTPVDRAFGAAFRAALRAGVEAAGLRCGVDPEGLTALARIPVETYDPSAPVSPLPDHVRAGLRLLVVGLNPGHYSAWHRGYFARPGNRFWPAMRAARIVPTWAGPGSEAWCCRTLGIGFTDVVKRPTRSIEELAPTEWAVGAERLRELVRRYRPRAVLFVGLHGARAVLGRAVEPGRAAVELEGSAVFVLPSTSGRQATYRSNAIAAAARELARWLASPEGGEP
jgi:sugar fermentation stimulation protein A